jgi:dihydrofolate reductase
VRVTLVAAVARNGVIGRGQKLPWRLPADLRHFKALTLGHTLLMGRKTWESLPGVLPGRQTIVLSRSCPEVPSGVEVVESLSAAIDLARDAGETELFVAGGGGVYSAALKLADRMVLSQIAADVEGDTFFPEWDSDAWIESGRQEVQADSENPWDFAIVEFTRA